ncbi:MAG: peptidyl-prolyl cis-trans isomerase [Desulfarculaceae bacterium]|nr:peptidyl-prolyl cis-trans isomerase [Desulfarculaceae bacterium]MCF8047513.1 peptidyl-prolyl cis-trans isomerase [Desulfarculaceae bacterium]MCF8065035.1 peptidyl-prolyl cis-trans isomerase [Desulfarculaceae bacterium]MCF8097916.1 peptidyl-prolyl cis-trans isomerase [Desulfarculaceae bacterium]MCF8120840.1 peptidyl-prolyl cis-trans isomerase [Desulfarculaceae bacterium]
MAGLITSQQMAARRVPRGILWAVGILLALVLAACSSGDPEGPPAVARVDGKPLTLAEFNSRAAFMGLGGDPALLEPELRRAVVEDLVGRALVLAEAERQGVVLLPEELDKREEQLLSRLDPEALKHNLAIHGISLEQWRRELAEQLLMEKALRLILRPRIRVTPNEIAAFYRDHRSEFHRPEQILAQHALLPSKPLAQKLVNQVQEGMDMSLAADQMGAPLAGGGQPTWLSRGHMPPGLEKKVFALKPGQLAGPLPSPYGFHVVRVKAKRPAMALSLTQAAPEIQKNLVAQKQEALAISLLEELKAKSDIIYDQQFLEEGRLAPVRSK